MGRELHITCDIGKVGHVNLFDIYRRYLLYIPHVFPEGCEPGVHDMEW